MYAKLAICAIAFWRSWCLAPCVRYSPVFRSVNYSLVLEHCVKPLRMGLLDIALSLGAILVFWWRSSLYHAGSLDVQ